MSHMKDFALAAGLPTPLTRPQPASPSQIRYVLRLILDLTASPFASNMEAALSAAGVPLNRLSWAEALEVAALTTPAASRLITALIRLRQLDEAA